MKNFRFHYIMNNLGIYYRIIFIFEKLDFIIMK